MKLQLLLAAAIIALANYLYSQKVEYQKFFDNKQLRIDYIRAGNYNTNQIYIHQYKIEPYWGGSQKNLIDTFNYGEYRFRAYDKQTNTLIFSKTYSTLFHEWQATDEAYKLQRSFYEVVTMPLPLNPIIIKFEKSNRQNIYVEEYSAEIDPRDLVIRQGTDYNFKIVDISVNGTSDKTIDVAFIAEGYTKQEEKKFIDDCKRFASYLFSYEPFASHKNKFNIRAVCSFSPESGTDIPQNNIWRRTVLNSSFNTFGSDRYLTTLDARNVYDIAALVPYDQICILVNTAKYGGGGFYNFYNLTAADNEYARQIFVHEFGHSFGGLADEYSSNESFDTLYNINVEPREPNITTLKNFNRKWQSLIADTVPIPTPVIAKYLNVVGVFEGAGYQQRNIYRPMYSCLMRELRSQYCTVCQKSLVKMIKFLTE